MNFLILLDGPKGAGKTTVCGLLYDKLPGTVFTDWGSIWRSVFKEKPKDEDDQAVLDVALQRVRTYLRSGKNVVLDNHLTEKRLWAFNELGKDCGVTVLRYNLTAPVEVLLQRLRQRDATLGRKTDEERFHSMYQMQQAKDFSGFKSFNTTDLSSEAIAESILEDLKESGWL